MSRVVHFYKVPEDGSVFETVVPSGTELLDVKWRQDPMQPRASVGDVVLYVEKPVNGETDKFAYRAERKLKVFLVPSGAAFDQAEFKYAGTVRQPGYGQTGGSGFWHVYACLTEVDG